MPELKRVIAVYGDHVVMEQTLPEALAAHFKVPLTVPAPIPSQELPRVLLELCAALKPRGVLFSSNPRGHNEEGWSDGCYGACHDLEIWQQFMQEARFYKLTHYYRSAGLLR